MTDASHRVLRELLGAYALDQLGTADRARIDAHLAGCPACRAELADLRPVVAALADFGLPEDREPVVPVDLRSDVLSAVRGRRAARRLRRIGAAVAVAGLAAAAYAVGMWVARPALPPVVDAPIVALAAGVRADAGLVRHTWGTELRLEATGLTDGAGYTVTFLRDDGSRIPAGGFLGTGDRALTCSLNAAVAIESATEVVVVDEAGRPVIDAVIG